MPKAQKMKSSGKKRASKSARSERPSHSTSVSKVHPAPPKDAEEEELEELVFGSSFSKARELLAAPLAAVDGVKGGGDFILDPTGTASVDWTFNRSLNSESGVMESEEEEEMDMERDMPLFTIDTVGANGAAEGDDSDEDEEEVEEASNPVSIVKTKKGVQAAWTDIDDLRMDIYSSKRLRKLRTTATEKVVDDYEERLRQQYQKLNPQVSWATLPEPTSSAKDGEAEEGDLDAFKRANGIISAASKTILTPEFLPVLRLKDANQTAYSQAVIQVVEFHPSAPVMLTCGYDKTLRIFQIDGKLNPKIVSLHIKDLPIHSAHFTSDGKKVILSGKRKHFYAYDMNSGHLDRTERISGREEKGWMISKPSPCNKYIAFLGRDGYIVLVSMQTKQWVANFKMNGSVSCFAFSADGSYIYSFGEEGEIYTWDVEERTCIHRFLDEGCVKATALAVSPDGQFIATGSSSGVVNLYKIVDTKISATPSPVKTFLHLTTSISTLVFHPDSQILAMGSAVKQDEFRLIHVPSLSVFQNWPTSKTPLGRVCTAGFSSDGSHAVIANDKGKVLLYKLLPYA